MRRGEEDGFCDLVSLPGVHVVRGTLMQPVALDRIYIYQFRGRNPDMGDRLSLYIIRFSCKLKKVGYNLCKVYHAFYRVR